MILGAEVYSLMDGNDFKRHPEKEVEYETFLRGIDLIIDKGGNVNEAE